MIPYECVEKAESVKTKLGNEHFEKLIDQLSEAGASLYDILQYGSKYGYVVIPAAHAAAILLRQVHKQFPQNSLAAWPLLEQLDAVYNIIGYEQVFSFCDATITFASDLRVNHIVGDFANYPTPN